MNAGHTNNPAGRPKGTPNRVTSELRAALKSVLAGEIDRLPAHFEALDTQARVDLLVKLLPYTLPKVEPSPFHVGESVDIGDSLAGF